MRKFATLFYWQRQHCWFGAICFRRRCRAIFWHADHDCGSYNDDGSTDYNYDDNVATDDYDCRSNNNDDGSTDYNYDDNRCSYNDDNDCRSNNNDDGSTDYNYDDNRCSYNDDNDCRSNNNNDDGSTDYNYDDNDCRSSIKCYGAANYYDVNNYRPKKCLQRLDHFCIADFGNTGCQILFGGVGDMSKQNE